MAQAVKIAPRSDNTLMPMDVMHVRRVWMGVSEGTVLMPMGVRFARRVVWRMLVSVVFVMHMRMHVRRDVVDMLMLVTLRDVEPNSETHENAGSKQRECDVLSKRHDGDHGTQERRG
jgi:hypothetical protein